MTEQTADTLLKLGLAALTVIIPAVALFVAKWFDLHTKYNELKLRMAALELDNTNKANKLAVEAQEIIQRQFLEKEARLQTLESRLEHQRDLIDEVNSLNAKLETQQQNNITRINELNVEREEHNKLIKELQGKADTRHREMAKITGTNMELTLLTNRLRDDISNALRLLRECYEARGLPTPSIVLTSEQTAQFSAADNNEEPKV